MHPIQYTCMVVHDTALVENKARAITGVIACENKARAITFSMTMS